MCVCVCVGVCVCVCVCMHGTESYEEEERFRVSYGGVAQKVGHKCRGVEPRTSIFLTDFASTGPRSSVPH